MANITPFTGITKLDLPTDQVLESAKEFCTGGVIVLGSKENGELYFHSSMSSAADVVLFLALAQKFILEQSEI